MRKERQESRCYRKLRKAGGIVQQLIDAKLTFGFKKVADLCDAYWVFDNNSSPKIQLEQDKLPPGVICRSKGELRLYRRGRSGREFYVGMMVPARITLKLGKQDKRKTIVVEAGGEMPQELCQAVSFDFKAYEQV